MQNLKITVDKTPQNNYDLVVESDGRNMAIKGLPGLYILEIITKQFLHPPVAELKQKKTLDILKEETLPTEYRAPFLKKQMTAPIQEKFDFGKDIGVTVEELEKLSVQELNKRAAVIVSEALLEIIGPKRIGINKLKQTHLMDMMGSLGLKHQIDWKFDITSTPVKNLEPDSNKETGVIPFRHIKNWRKEIILFTLQKTPETLIRIAEIRSKNYGLNNPRIREYLTNEIQKIKKKGSHKDRLAKIMEAASRINLKIGVHFELDKCRKGLKSGDWKKDRQGRYFCIVSSFQGDKGMLNVRMIQIL